MRGSLPLRSPLRRRLQATPCQIFAWDELDGVGTWHLSSNSIITSGVRTSSKLSHDYDNPTKTIPNLRVTSGEPGVSLFQPPSHLSDPYLVSICSGCLHHRTSSRPRLRHSERPWREKYETLPEARHPRIDGFYRCKSCVIVLLVLGHSGRAGEPLL